MKNIGAALLKVQQELNPVKKGKKGHNNKYADLPAVLDEAVQKLNENGIVVLQPIQPASQPNHARVETVLLHAESGEQIVGAAEVPWRSESKMNDAQSYGSAVTYARRYSLVSILGISTEDDDGKSAYAPPARTEQPAPKSEPSPEQKEAKAKQFLDTLDGWLKNAPPEEHAAHIAANIDAVKACMKYDTLKSRAADMLAKVEETQGKNDM